MREPPRSRWNDFLTGAAVGALAGLIVKELDLTTVISFWGERAPLVVTAALVGALAWLTRLRTLVGLTATSLALLWLAVAFTPLTPWMADGLERRDEREKADAVFVLASGLQRDGELTTSSMSRLVRGLELIGEGRSSRLILTELGAKYPRYRSAAEELIENLGLEVEVISVGPVRNTHDEAVLVSEKVRALGLERIIVVTSPSHTRRACAVLESEGVTVTCIPAQQIRFDFDNLDDSYELDNRLESFSSLLHEHVGLVYYRMRGWIQ